MAGAGSTDASDRFDLDRVTEGSYAIALLHGASRPLAATTRWLADVTRRSFCYRWLTKEPEPEVVVIDLRDTVTVGPLIALLDRLAAALAPTARTLDRAWQSSTLYRVGDRVAGWIERAVQTRVGRAVVRLLEPPEPPENERE